MTALSLPDKTARRAPTLASLLAHGEPDRTARTELRRLVRQCLVPVAIVGALLGAWVFSAPLAGAVIAPAQVKVELNRKTVQHQEGGIVREIRVREGQKVQAGDVLMVVGDVRNDAELDLTQDQLLAALARRARASAEAALVPSFAPPAEFVDADWPPERSLEHDAERTEAAAAEHLARERALFAARRRTLDEQVASLQEQIRQAQAQATALQARIDATEASARLSDEELQVNEQLVQQGFVNRTRLLTLQRASADYRARVAEFRSELAAVRQRSGELHARIAQLRNQYRSQAADELKEASAQVRELQQRLRPSRDLAERRFVRAPVDGTVMAVRVAAAGTAIGPREPLLDLVPANERLVVEARIRPEDIEHVHRDAAAEVRLSGLDASLIRPLQGRVTFVSPDRLSNPETRESWYAATVEVDGAELRNRPDVRLQPGLPAEVFVATAERTLFEYLAKPISIFSSRALREP
jgi:HlyD family type I secretion membrane fusion protein